MADVRMKDIAKATGVSVVTVSNALSGKKGVSEELREKIEKTAKDMGYNPSKSEKREQSFVIGVLASEKYITVGISFYWAMYQNVAYEVSKKQGVTMLEVLSMEKEGEMELPRLMNEKTISGLIIIGWMSRAYIEKLVAISKVPIVLLDFQMRGIRCDSVMSSNYIGMYKMTRYLIERGHRDIAFVGSILANENIMDRYYGYRKGLEEAGIRERKEWVLEDRDLVTGISRMELPENMPTAFVCNSDWTAGVLYEKLKKIGYRVPEDISIVGYDNYLYGNNFADQITTYNVDMKEMAVQAVKLLIGKIKGDNKYWGTRYVDSEIVERNSVKCLN